MAIKSRGEYHLQCSDAMYRNLIFDWPSSWEVSLISTWCITHVDRRCDRCSLHALKSCALHKHLTYSPSGAWGTHYLSGEKNSFDLYLVIRIIAASVSNLQSILFELGNNSSAQQWDNDWKDQWYSCWPLLKFSVCNYSGELVDTERWMPYIKFKLKPNLLFCKLTSERQFTVRRSLYVTEFKFSEWCKYCTRSS